MKTNQFILLAICLSLAACKPHEAEKAAEKKEPEKVSPVSHNEKGETVLKLDADAVKRVGVKTEPLAAADFAPEARAFGRVLDPAPLTVLVSELATVQLAYENIARELELVHKRREADLTNARTALKNSQENIPLTKAQGDAEIAAAQAAAKATALDLDRTKTLAKQNNASERALQTAETAAAKDVSALETTKATAARAAQAAAAAAQRDQLQLELTDAATQSAVQTAEAAVHSAEVAAFAVRAKIISGYSRALVELPNLPEFAAALNVGKAVLVRLEVPAGETLKESPTGATLLIPGAAGEVLAAELFGPGTTGATDAQTQGQGFLVTLKSGHERLRAGMSVTGALQLPGDAEHGVTVPRAAIVRHEGEAFIYLETKAGEFTKKEIELEHATPGGWFVHEGLKAGEKIVITGAQQLLSEESKGKD